MSKKDDVGMSFNAEIKRVIVTPQAGSTDEFIEVHYVVEGETQEKAQVFLPNTLKNLLQQEAYNFLKTAQAGQRVTFMNSPQSIQVEYVMWKHFKY